MAATFAARTALLYFGAVNVGSVALFAHDKRAAIHGQQRVPERTLCRTAIFGGWPGALIAMQLLRHKTRKRSFQKKYVAAIGTNALVTVPAAVLAIASPAARSAFVNAFSRRARWGGGRTPPRWRR